MPLEPRKSGQDLSGWTNWALNMWWNQGPLRTIIHIDMMLDRMTRWGRRDMLKASQRDLEVISHLKDLRSRMGVALVGLNISPSGGSSTLDDNPSPS